MDTRTAPFPAPEAEDDTAAPLCLLNGAAHSGAAEAQHREVADAFAMLGRRVRIEMPPDCGSIERRAREAAEARAPLVIGVVSSPRDHDRIPEWEQFLSGGAAAMNLVIAANALGYGTNWISNWYSDDAEGRLLLGLAPHERVIGFVHVGTFKGEMPERPRPDSAGLYADYAGPWKEERRES